MRERVVLVATGVVITVTGAVFVLVGLENADRIASTVGALAGIAGLGLSVLSWTARRPGPGPAPTAPPSGHGVQITAKRIDGLQTGDHSHQENTFHSGRPLFRRRRGDRQGRSE
jgi:hypothetical protein